MARTWPSDRPTLSRILVVVLITTLALVGTAPARPASAVTAPTYVDLEVGRLHGCAVMSDGTVRCWGFDRSGQIGDGTTGDDVDQRPVPRQVVGLTGAVEVAVGGDHTCARRSDGTVRCWGSGAHAQLGNGSFGEFLISSVPVTVTGLSDAVSISAGGIHTCAVRSTGGVVCWGGNGNGQLGDGTTGNADRVRTTPVAVSGIFGATKVAASDSASCALLVGGSVACWGWGAFGQLGDGTKGDADHNRLTPVSAIGLTGVTDLAGGTDHMCASNAGGSVRCWGYNGRGQVGTGATDTKALVPTLVPSLDDAVGVAAGVAHSCIRRANGVVGCWGDAQNGQIGDGAEGDANGQRLIPTAASGIGSATVLDAGGRTTCAIVSPSTVRCWGDDSFGQLGNGRAVGDPTESLLPIVVGSTPSAPATPTAVAARGSATVSWSVPASTGGSPIAGYTITPYLGATAQAPVTTTGAGTSKTVTGLTDGATYTFRVAARNETGRGSDSPPSTAVVPGALAAAPTIGAALGAPGAVTVRWTAPTDTGGLPITGYRVTGTAPGIPTINATYLPGSTVQTIGGLTNGLPYRFTVRAINDKGTGPPSATSNPVEPGVPFAPYSSWNTFVAGTFTDITASPPTAAEQSAWVAALAGGTVSKGGFVEVLRRGPDNTAAVDPVARLYRAFLGRAPDASGLRFWIARKRAGTWSVTKMADAFAGSSEFKTKYGTLTNRQFVTRIYDDVLQRTADAGGVDYWTAKLDTKQKTRGGVMVGFSESNEYRTKQRANTDIAIAHTFLLRRAATAAEAADWSIRLAAGTTHVDLLCELLESAAFAQRFAG